MTATSPVRDLAAAGEIPVRTYAAGDLATYTGGPSGRGEFYTGLKAGDLVLVTGVSGSGRYSVTSATRISASLGVHASDLILAEFPNRPVRARVTVSADPSFVDDVAAILDDRLAFVCVESQEDGTVVREALFENTPAAVLEFRATATAVHAFVAGRGLSVRDSLEFVS